MTKSICRLADWPGSMSPKSHEGTKYPPAGTYPSGLSGVQQYHATASWLTATMCGVWSMYWAPSGGSRFGAMANEAASTVSSSGP